MLKRKTVIGEGSSIRSVETALQTRGVARVEVRLGASEYFAQGQLHALRGPEGHVSTATHTGMTLGEALDKMCQELDAAAEREICVFDAGRSLRGRYPNDAEGRKYADTHFRALLRETDPTGLFQPTQRFPVDPSWNLPGVNRQK